MCGLHLIYTEPKLERTPHLTLDFAYLIALEIPLSGGSLSWRDLKGLVGVSSAGLLWLPMMDPDCPVRASSEFTYGGMPMSGYWGWY